MIIEHISKNILSLILDRREDLRDLGFDQTIKAQEFDHWLSNHGVFEYPILRDLIKDKVSQSSRGSCIQRPFGVNLVGYAFGELGIGEDVRMAARAMLSTGIPMTLVNFKPGDAIPQNDRSMQDHVSNVAQYGVNIFCMTAEENARQFLSAGQGVYSGRYNIGYWPWELSGWPKAWVPSFELVDEVWVSTWHTYDALADICHKPLFRMPMAVETPEIKRFASKQMAREYFNLPRTAKLFCFSFDFNSSIHRKNPKACVDAFLTAFPRRRFDNADVGLVIKVHTPKEPNPDWQALKRLMNTDNRIHIIEGTLPKPALLSLYKACDCFVSLHRAEGFGRGIAEALKLGLHVIATGYSGNIDFCRAPQADLVDYDLIPIKPGQYPFGDGQVWAEPNIEHAAKLMWAFAQKEAAPRKQTRWSEFSAKTVGKRFCERLLQIRAENPDLFN